MTRKSKPGCKRFVSFVMFAFGLSLWLGLCPHETWADDSKEAQESSFSYEWSVYGGLRFRYTKNGLDSELSPPVFNQDVIGGTLLLGGEVELKFNPYVALKVAVDIGEMNVLQTNSTAVPSEGITPSSSLGFFLGGYNFLTSSAEFQEQQSLVEACKQSAREQGISESECNNPLFLLQESFYIRQLHTTFSFQKSQWTQLSVVMFNSKLGRSFIMDSFVLGASFDMNLLKRKGNPLPMQFELEAFLPDSSFTTEGKMSPVLNAKLSFTRGKNRKVSLFATYMYDGNNLAGKLLLPLWQEYFMTSVSDQVRARTGTAISPSCENGEFTEAEKTAITQAFSPETRRKVQQQLQAGNDLLETYYDELCNRVPTSYGHHIWVGLQGKWTWKSKFSLEGAAIFYIANTTIGLPRGSLLVKPPPNNTRFRPPGGTRTRRPPRGDTRQPLTAESLTPQQTTPRQQSQFNTELQDRPLNMLSFVGELQASYNWVPKFSTSLFFLFAMGDSFRQKKSTVNAFMGIVPQVRYTNVFFNGGINAYSSKRGLGISGIAGKGYITPGLSIDYLDGPDYFRKANFNLTAAAHWALEPSIYKDSKGNSGQFYGVEVNLVGGYRVLPWLRPVAQVDFFFPGNFFASASPPALLFQVLVGLDFLFYG